MFFNAFTWLTALIADSAIIANEKSKSRDAQNAYQAYLREHPPKQQKKYAEPHRDRDGKIIIENCTQYYKDLNTFGAYQTQQWVEQGKYNLTKDELKMEELRIERKYLELFAIGSTLSDKEQQRLEELKRMGVPGPYD